MSLSSWVCYIDGMHDDLTKYQRYYRKKKLADPTHNADRQREWRERNRDRARQLLRQSYARHRRKRIAEARQRFRTLKEAGYSDEYRLKDRMRKAKRRAAMCGVECTLTIAEWLDICRQHNYRCAYCGRKLPLEQDHVVPFHRGGGHTRANVVPACKPCNSSKRHDRTKPAEPANTRSTPGRLPPNASLTARQVRAIRRLRGHLSQRAIGERFGIGQSQVSRIILRKAWGWVS